MTASEKKTQLLVSVLSNPHPSRPIHFFYFNPFQSFGYHFSTFVNFPGHLPIAISIFYPTTLIILITHVFCFKFSLYVMKLSYDNLWNFKCNTKNWLSFESTNEYWYKAMCVYIYSSFFMKKWSRILYWFYTWNFCIEWTKLYVKIHSGEKCSLNFFAKPRTNKISLRQCVLAVTANWFWIVRVIGRWSVTGKTYG